MDDNTPAFETWEREALNNFAYSVHKRILEIVEQNLQLRREIKAVTTELHKQKDDWK